MARQGAVPAPGSAAAELQPRGRPYRRVQRRARGLPRLPSLRGDTALNIKKKHQFK